MKKLMISFFMVIILLATPLLIYGAPPQLEKKAVLSNRVEILLPKGFTIMSDKMAKVKYPNGNRPTLIYTNESASINIAFNYTPSRLNNDQIPQFKDAMEKMLQGAQPAATWISDGVTVINKKKVGYLELVTPAVDTKIYNLMFFEEMDQRALLITFNCVEKQMKSWQPVAKKIMNSLKVK